MWSWLWRSRDRFSLDQLRYLIDQLQKIHIVNKVNQDFVIESLRSISELLTYGDQHDPSFFDYFMEKHVMGDFVRILNISKSLAVSVQLLQTMSIIIQNLKSEHAIYYLFSNEHLNSLIIYNYDFQNEELLSYYISFLRAISGKLNPKTISLLVKMNDGNVASFALYVEAIRFAFNEESMIRTAVRTVTLNIYHVGDEAVNRFITEQHQANYFSDFVEFFKKQCLSLNALVSDYVENSGSNSTKAIYAAVDEIEDHLYYFSDAISAGIPDLGRLLTDFLLQLLIFPLLLPSLCLKLQENIGSIVSMFLLCCVLRIVKYKDLANTVAATMFCRLEALFPTSKLNGFYPDLASSNNLADGLEVQCVNASIKEKSQSDAVVRDILLYYITDGNEQEVIGSINLLATLLQTKELDETMLDALGILPQRKQQKKLLLETLVGEAVGEEQLFSAESDSSRDPFNDELDCLLQKIKDKYDVMRSSLEVKTNHRARRLQVVDVLVHLMSRTDISAQTLWEGGWLLRQLLPCNQPEFPSHTLKLLTDLRQKYAEDLIRETKGDWSDLLVPVLSEEWKKCKLAIEASSLRKDPKTTILPPRSSPIDTAGEISYISGEKMRHVVKRFVLLQQLAAFANGRISPEKPPVAPPSPKSNRTGGFDFSNPKPGNELKFVDAIPCRISFERGKERHLFFLAVSDGTSGWMILAEESPREEERRGVIRIVVPLCGSNRRVDEKHPKWLHLRVRLTCLPSKNGQKAVVDGRWTLAFRDEESCKSAVALIDDHLHALRIQVQRRIAPLVNSF